MDNEGSHITLPNKVHQRPLQLHKFQPNSISGEAVWSVVAISSSHVGLTHGNSDNGEHVL